jgi:uncharacterized protein YuzE
VKIRYDRDVDAITIVFQSDREVQESDEPNPGVVMDYDAHGGLVSIEVLDASSRFEDLDSVQYEKTSSST